MDIEELTKRIRNLSGSQSSVTATSKFCMNHPNEAKTIVHIWNEDFSTATTEKKLALLYLANDILQNSRKDGTTFAAEFYKIIQKAVVHLSKHGNASIKKAVIRLVEIWEERKVFGYSIINKMKEGIARVDTETEDKRKRVKITNTDEVITSLDDVENAKKKSEKLGKQAYAELNKGDLQEKTEEELKNICNLMKHYSNSLNEVITKATKSIIALENKLEAQRNVVTMTKDTHNLSLIQQRKILDLISKNQLKINTNIQEQNSSENQTIISPLVDATTNAPLGQQQQPPPPPPLPLPPISSSSIPYQFRSMSTPNVPQLMKKYDASNTGNTVNLYTPPSFTKPMMMTPIDTILRTNISIGIGGSSSSNHKVSDDDIRLLDKNKSDNIKEEIKKKNNKFNNNNDNDDNNNDDNDNDNENDDNDENENGNGNGNDNEIPPPPPPFPPPSRPMMPTHQNFYIQNYNDGGMDYERGGGDGFRGFEIHQQNDNRYMYYNMPHQAHNDRYYNDGTSSGHNNNKRPFYEEYDPSQEWH